MVAGSNPGKFGSTYAPQICMRAQSFVGVIDSFMTGVSESKKFSPQVQNGAVVSVLG